MSVYSVVRKVDTVIITMDASVAEALLEVTAAIEDLATMKPIRAIAEALRNSGEIREPSPLYDFDFNGATLSNRTAGSLEKAYFAVNGTLDECGECDGKMNSHFLSCTVWNFKR